MKALLSICFALFLAMPVGASAAETAFFRLTYTATATNGDTFLPIAASWHGSGEAAGYEILRSGTIRTKYGTATGIVLSNAPVVSGRYLVHSGETEAFTLFVMYRADTDMPSTDYALRLSHLPYWKGDTTEFRHVRSELLSAFETDALRL